MDRVKVHHCVDREEDHHRHDVDVQQAIRYSLVDDRRGADRVVRDHHGDHHGVDHAKDHRCVGHHDHHDEDHAKGHRYGGHHDRRGADHTQVRHFVGHDHHGDHHGVDHAMVHRCVDRYDRHDVVPVKDPRCAGHHDRRGVHGRKNSRWSVVGVRHRSHGVGREAVHRGVGREAVHPDGVHRDVALAYRLGHHVGCDQIVIRLLEAGGHRRLCVDYSYV